MLSCGVGGATTNHIAQWWDLHLACDPLECSELSVGLYDRDSSVLP